MWEAPAFFLRLYKKKSTILPTKYSAFLVEITGPILTTVTLLQSMHGALLGELSPHSFGNNKKTPHVGLTVIRNEITYQLLADGFRVHTKLPSDS